MDSFTDMHELSKRANVDVKEFLGKPLIRYEDHRYILNVIKHAFCKGVLTTPPNLFYFDYHNDDCSTRLSDEELRKIAACSQRDFWSFVEWDSSPLDDDWLDTAIKLNLIKDVVSDVSEDTHYDQRDIKDIYGNTHHVYSVHPFWDSLSNHKGRLVDTARKSELKPIWDIFDWDFMPDRKHFDFKTLSNPLIIDFDLDYFTMHYNQFIFAWRQEIFDNSFFRRNESYMTPLSFIKDLIHKSSFVTIALESSYCGGLNEATYIYQILMDFLEKN